MHDMARNTKIPHEIKDDIVYTYPYYRKLNSVTDTMSTYWNFIHVTTTHVS